MGSIPVFPDDIGDDWSPRISFSNSFSCNIDITQAIVDDYYVHHDRRPTDRCVTNRCCANQTAADSAYAPAPSACDQQFEFSVVSPHQVHIDCAADCRTDRFPWQDQPEMIVDPHQFYQRMLPADELFCNGKLRVSKEQRSCADCSAAEMGKSGSECDHILPESINPCSNVIENGDDGNHLQRSGEDDESISEEWVQIQHGRRQQRIDGRGILNYGKPSARHAPDFSTIRRQSNAVVSSSTDSVTESEKSDGNLDQQHGGIPDDQQATMMFRRRFTAAIGSPLLISDSNGEEFEGESCEMQAPIEVTDNHQREPSVSNCDAESASSFGGRNYAIDSGGGHEKSITATRSKDIDAGGMIDAVTIDGQEIMKGEDWDQLSINEIGSTESPCPEESDGSSADRNRSGGAQAESDPPDLPVPNSGRDAAAAADDDHHVDFDIVCRCRSISTTHSSPSPDRDITGRRRSTSGRAALIRIAATLGPAELIPVSTSQRSTPERSALVGHHGGELPDQRPWELTSRQMLLLAAARRSVERNAEDADESRRRHRRRDSTDGSDAGDGGRSSGGSDVDTSVSSEGKGEMGSAEFDEKKEEEMAAIREMLARKLQWSRRRGGGGDCRSSGHVKPPPHHRKCISLINLNYHQASRGHRQDEKNESGSVDVSAGKSAAAAAESSTSFRSLSLPSPPKSDSRRRRRTGGSGIMSFLQEIITKPKVVGAAAASVFGGGGGRLAFWRLAAGGGGGGGNGEMGGVHIDTSGSRSVDLFKSSSPPIRTTKCPWRTKSTMNGRTSSFSQPPSPTSGHHRSGGGGAAAAASPLCAVSVDDSLYMWKGRWQARPAASPEAGKRVQGKSGMVGGGGGGGGGSGFGGGGGGHDGVRTKLSYRDGAAALTHHHPMTSASVRVAPVLHVPSCITPASLRSKSSSKVKQLSHLLFSNSKHHPLPDHHPSQRPAVNAPPRPQHHLQT